MCPTTLHVCIVGLIVNSMQLIVTPLAFRGQGVAVCVLLLCNTCMPFLCSHIVMLFAVPVQLPVETPEPDSTQPCCAKHEGGSQTLLHSRWSGYIIRPGYSNH